MGGFLPLVLGVVFWVGFLVAAPAGDTDSGIVQIVTLAILVVVPLGLRLFRAPDDPGTNLFGAAVYLQPFAGLVACASFLLPAGVLAGTLAIAWLPVTGMLALDAANRALQRGLVPLEELAVDAAAIFLPIGAFWLWASRMGLEPFGFTEPIVILTAVHFHYAGFAGPLIAGLTGRHLRGNGAAKPLLYAPSVLLIVIGPVLVPAGIVMAGTYEALGAIVLAAGYIGLALATLFSVIRSLEGPLAKVLLGASSFSIALAMAAWIAFAVGNASKVFFIPIATMVQLHGWLNAFGFAVLGLLGWALVSTDSRG